MTDFDKKAIRVRAKINKQKNIKNKYGRDLTFSALSIYTLLIILIFVAII